MSKRDKLIDRLLNRKISEIRFCGIGRPDPREHRDK